VAISQQLWKIVSQVQGGSYVIWYFKSKSVITIQRFWVGFGREAPVQVFICK